jgi:hypothetical protein
MLHCAAGVLLLDWRFESCVMAKRTQTRFIARMTEGAVPSEMPGFIAPQLATLKSKARRVNLSCCLHARARLV